MANVFLTGSSPDPINDAFDSVLDPVIEVNSPTAVHSRNPENNFLTIFSGVGLGFSGLGVPAGTLTGIQILNGSGQSQLQITGIVWSFEQFVAAIRASIDFDNSSGFFQLLSAQPLVVDASTSGVPVDLGFAGVTSQITLLGSNFQDRLQGGDGNDTIRPGGGDSDDFILGSRGNDLIDLTGASAITYVDVDYQSLNTPITATVNGFADSITVLKGSGQGTDTVTGARFVMQQEGLGITGSVFNDVFNISGVESYLQIVAGAGNDTFNIDLNGGGTVRLVYNYGPSVQQSTGVNVNLASGFVQNDGFGGQDQITVVGNTGRVEVYATDFADTVTGSGRDERFILAGGNDILDAGGGYDLLRFDRNQTTAGVVGDLVTGVFTGSWRGAAFSKSIVNIEEVRGSDFADVLRGTAGNERFEGRGGNDLLEGRGGDDRLYGQDGNDTLLGGDGNDRLDGGAGNDRLEVGRSAFGGGDQINGSAGSDTIVYTGVGNGDGYNDLSYDDLNGRIAVTINGAANTGSVVKSLADGSGTDTFVDVSRVLADGNDGFNLYGTTGSDSFVVDAGVGNQMQIIAGRGADSYDLTLSGTIRLNFSGSWNEWMGATQGLDLNIATGVIANDGFGDAETLTVHDGDGELQIRATRNADRIIGSARDESFISEGGNDTIDGGGGWDTVRYNRSEATGAVTVSLSTGVVAGTWAGVAFTQSLSNIERIQGTAFGDVMGGSLRDESFDGNDGNDILYGYGGDDDLHGGAGNDQLVGGLGNDYLEGGDGNDTLDGSDDTTGWGDYIRPGLGANTIIGSQALYQVAQDGIDISYSDISGVGGLTILVGANGTGTVRSGIAGLVNDTFSWTHFFQGSQDADVITINGSDGDWFEGFSGYAGNDTINGGTGYDDIDYRSEAREHRDTAQGVQVNLTTGTAIDTYGDTDMLLNIESVRGTFLADAVIARNAADAYLSFRGYAGADTLTGSVLGYERADYQRDADDGGTAGIVANLAAGTIRDGFGDLDRVSDIDEVRGTAAGDYISGAGLGERLRGEAGNDTILGNDGHDRIEGGDGNDYIGGGAGNDYIDAGAGNNTIFGGLGNDTVQGGDAYDEIYGSAGLNQLFGNGGNDFIQAGTGGDFIGGGAGNDTIRGGGGSDTIYAGLGDDNVGGGAGNDLIYGSAGRNVIYAGLGNDTVQGGAGSDTIYGSAGRNQLFGNDGNDLIFTSVAGDIAAGGAGNDSIFGSDGADTIYAGLGDDFIGGGAGNDLIVAGAGTNRIYGGAGNDTVIAGAGKDVISGGPGADVFIFQSAAQIGAGTARDVITDFTSGVDLINIAALQTQFNGSAGLLGGGAASFYYYATGGLLIGDSDGNSTVDWVLELSGAPTITMADFTL
jgi:Ca2+-binding RTX toxin-like protein